MKQPRGHRPARHETKRVGEQPVAPTDGTRAASDELDEAAGAGDGPRNAPVENRRSARAFLIAAAQVVVFVPVLFYLQFGEVNAFALSFTGFLVVLCLLVALGYSIPDKPEQQTPATPATQQVSLPARVGAFWLVACAFGPFFGWLITAPEFALTEGDWWWRYAARAVLSIGLPVLTALPLFIYARGRYWYVALLLLVGVTSLSAWSGVNTLLDLREGPTVERATGYYDAPHNSFYPSAEGRPFKLTTLAHTQRTIRIEPAAPPGEREE